jgi:H/ACA ribonucleoprotein complex subunit 4
MKANQNLLPSDKKRKRIIKTKLKTNPKYGKKPDERETKELLNNGLINLDKPCGPTSHQVDAWLKDIFKNDKVGHSGTLDPNATGVLPIAIGDATKALHALLSAGKEYIGIMKLHKQVDEKKIITTCKKFIGSISQVPPVRSAVKRVKRKRHIYYLDVIEIKEREVLFRVGCESGTYIRTLCVDIGKKLNCKAHLEELRRTRVGNLSEEKSYNLQDIKDSYYFWKENYSSESIRSVVMPMENITAHLPKIVVRDSAVDALCHGANLALPGVTEVDSDIKKGEMIAILTLKGEIVALATTTMITEDIIDKDKGVCAKLERVLMKKGTYPPIWKKS